MAMLLSVFCFVAYAQKTVTGTVVDAAGEPMIGVSVMVDGTTNGGVTDFDGNFTIKNVPDNGVLKFSYIGFKDQKVSVAGKESLKVTLEEDATGLEEIVVVGYGTMKKKDLTGSVASVKTDDLKAVAGANALTAMQAKVPGVDLQQSDGGQAGSGVSMTFRGNRSLNASNAPLVLVDGVEYGSTVDIPASDIESMDILKDAASTAIYGTKGANGVILITTKRGHEGKATININASTTLKSYSKLPDAMDSYDALDLRNKAIVKELAYAPEGWVNYTPKTIMDKYRHPANRAEWERYPNVNWIDELLKDVAMSYNANVNVSGGSRFVKYFASVDYSHEGDLYKKVRNVRGYNPGFSYDRINVRSNLDFSLTKTTQLHVNLSGSHAVRKATQAQYENLVWSAFYGIAPGAFRPVYDNGMWGYYDPNPTQAAQNSMEYLSTTGIGYTTVDRLNTDFTLEQDLSFITKGLRAQLKLAFDNSFQEAGRGIDDTNDWEDDAHWWIDPDTGIGRGDTQPETNYKFDYKNNNAWSWGAGSVQDWMTYRRLNYSAQLDYSRTFGDHTVGAMGNFSRERYNQGPEYPHYRENWVFRATYDYAHRYMLEYNGAYNGSEIFSSDNRFAFFNSGAIGWMVSEEPFMKTLREKHIIDMLKLRASYGEIGDDHINGRWLFRDTWTNSGNFRPGISSSGNPDFDRSSYTFWQKTQEGNPDLHWEKATKLDLAVDFGFLGGLITGSFDYFRENRTDILVAGADRAVPGYYGGNAPVANLGKVRSSGYELDIRYNKQLNKDWRLWGNMAFTHATNKILERDDPQLTPEYQKREGKTIGQTYTYLDHGYYNNWDELYGSTAHDEYDNTRMPGNYIILDYDADGVISQNDNIPYGFSDIPQNTFNFQIGVDYKGWSAFVQFYGTNNVSRSVNLQSLSDSRTSGYHEGSYWTPSNQNADVPLPRWNSNAKASTYTNGTRFMFDGSYLRLKYAEISYTFSKEKWLSSVGLQSLKLFVNGNNLALWTDMPDDRESNTGGWSAYPTARRFNLGLRVTL